MSAIKLFKIGTTKDGTERFKTQLELSRRSDSVSFIRDIDGIMMHWTYGDKGTGFYPFIGEFEIVNCIEDMQRQPL